MTDQEKRATAVKLIASVAETIRLAERVPSGTLYAGLMGVLTLQQYNSVIAVLKNAGLVREQNYELIWIGEPLLQEKN